jgi:prepilin-type N-terminal cleavage/methylation domain-containing protein
MHSRKLNRKHRSPRTAFTLVEIMVVVVIIGILAAILVPVLGGIIRRTNEAAVKVEIHSLENAIADFRAKFGCDPPDHIDLHEATNGWINDAESRSKILRIWPRFYFGTPTNHLYRDLNNNNNTTESFHLSGAECLVFFLGGMPKGDGNGGIFMTGFSKNPSNPFQPRTVDESRDGPFFEFPSARLHDHEAPGFKDGFPEFRDSLNNQTAPYLYLSSHSGSGYNTVRVSGTTIHISDGGFVFHFGLGNSPNPNLPTPNSNPLFWNRNLPYRQTPGGPHWKAKTFQIISPGYGPHENADGEFCPYGTADVYDPENTSTLSPLDADNITNFSQGSRLQP